jgi:hypothetical protein
MHESEEWTVHRKYSLSWGGKQVSSLKNSKGTGIKLQNQFLLYLTAKIFSLRLTARIVRRPPQIPGSLSESLHNRYCNAAWVTVTAVSG